METANDQPTNSRLRFVFRALGIAAVAAIAFCLVERGSGQRHLREVQHALEAEGLLRPRSSIVPPPSAEEIANGRRLLDLIEGPLRERRKDFPAFLSGPDAMQFVLPGSAVSGVTGEAPLFSKYAKDIPGNWVIFREQVMAGSEILDGVVELLKKPIAVEARSPNVKDPIGAVIALSAWFNASAISKLHDGDIPGAIDDLAYTQQLAAMVGRTYPLVDYSLETGSWKHPIFKTIWAILQMRAASDWDLDRLNRIVSQPNFVESGILGLTVEMASLADTLRLVESNETHKWGVRHPPGFFALRPVVSIRDILWPAVWKEKDFALTLSEAGENVRIGQDLAVKRNWQARKRKENSLPSAYDSWRFPFRDVFSLSPDSILLNSTKSETQRQMLIAAIALERYRLKHDVYPETLSALAPDFVKELPHDWFDGQPLKYRRLEPDGFKLYSVNEDGVDNGGNPEPVLWSASLDLFSGRDLVWPQLQK